MSYTHSPLMHCKPCTVLSPSQIRHIPQTLERRERSTILHPLLRAWGFIEARYAEVALACITSQSQQAFELTTSLAILGEIAAAIGKGKEKIRGKKADMDLGIYQYVYHRSATGLRHLVNNCPHGP